MESYSYQMPDLLFALAQMVVSGLEQQPLLGCSDLKHRNVALNLSVRLPQLLKVATNCSALVSFVFQRALSNGRRIFKTSNLQNQHQHT